MTIERRYEPDPEALDRVVEILYRLLIDPPDGRAEGEETDPPTGPPSTCVPVDSEQ